MGRAYNASADEHGRVVQIVDDIEIERVTLSVQL